MIDKLREIRNGYNIDCIDNSCLFRNKCTGMRTNGGCRCFNGRGNRPKPGELQAVSKVWRSMPELLDTIDEVVKLLGEVVLLDDHIELEDAKSGVDHRIWDGRRDKLLEKIKG